MHIYRYLPLLLLLSCTPDPPDLHRGWAHYGGDPGRQHYHAGTQIDTTNVGQLQVLWEYHTGDADTANHSQIQFNPIVINGVLYGASPQMKLFALDAVTGDEHWVFDPSDPSLDANGGRFKHSMINSRGIAHWTDGSEALW